MHNSAHRINWREEYSKQLEKATAYDATQVFPDTVAVIKTRR